MTPIWVTVLVVALTCIITIMVRESLLPVVTKIKLHYHRRFWKGRVPKGYAHRDKMLLLAMGSKLSVLGVDYEVTGLAEYRLGREISFEFSITRKRSSEEIERWLDFDGEKVIFWASWNDKEFWQEYLTAQVPEKVEPFPVKFFEEHLKQQQPRLVLGGSIKAKIFDAELRGEVENLYGGTEETPAPYLADYKCVAGVLENVKANIGNESRDTYVTCESYGSSEFFGYFSVGFQIQQTEIVPSGK